MKHVRASLRLLAVFALATLCAIAVVVTRALTPNGSERQIRAHARWVGRWGRWTCRAIGARVSWEGPVPQRPQVLVTNHLSYLDIIVLWNAAEGLFVSKAQVANWAFFGWAARIGGTLFIDRRKKSDLQRVRNEATARLAEGYGLIFFPEGTSTPGHDVLPFKPGLFSLVLDSGLPVHVASIHYATPAGAPPAAESVCWWGDMEFFPHLYRLLQIPRFDARIRFHPEPVAATDRKELADVCRARCREVFTPVDGAQPFDWDGPATS